MRTFFLTTFAALSLTLAPIAGAEEHTFNPVDCAFNPAFAHAHPAQCEGVTVEGVASNGGPDEAPEAPQE